MLYNIDSSNFKKLTKRIQKQIKQYKIEDKREIEMKQSLKEYFEDYAPLANVFYRQEQH